MGGRLREGEELARDRGVTWQGWDLHSDLERQSLALALLPVLRVLFFVGGWVFLCFGGEGEQGPSGKAP